ncbi:GNAT family N-acetyltransferase [Mucilaginibacter sp. UR6-1]|uniref:GNAT family N-acetyltransferase n=1 Tax=Mucilaginibacter sp. UR6-1 TaxID=1435643 RepID=UPI001E2EC2BB|nr:GNAT family N-acetyltransferase [Mucilaginibacter sp. UR6-1]MCC8409834.1 GNAT family N-acetyltransferase [Mucilaginibacter sp. UR6-1]
MTIREATLTDIPGIMTVVAEVVPLMQAAGNRQWSDTYPNTEVFTKDIELKQLWVAEHNGQLAGVTAITTAPEPDYAAAGIDITLPAVVTHRLAVSPRFQGLGIAVALLNHADEVARRHNIGKAQADTNTMNKAMQRLLERSGYKNIGEIGLAHKPGLSFYCYEKDIR